MIRLLPWFMLLHHIPGKCAPGESEDGHRPDEHSSSDGRVREHLLGGAGNVVAETRERMVAAVGREANYRAHVLAWAAREAIGTAPAATDLLRATVEEIREAAMRKTRKGIR